MSIFGPMEPRPVAQIVTRRHPLAFALYLTVLIMGVIFVFHWFGTHQTTEALFPGIPWWVIFAWKWEMLLGGALAAGSLTASPRSGPGWPDLADLLHLEGIGALTWTSRTVPPPAKPTTSGPATGPRAPRRRRRKK